jgi:hypothetical protein
MPTLIMQAVQQIQQQQQQQGCEGSQREATTPGPDDFVAESDALAYDKLAVDLASADPSDNFIPVEQIRPTESLLPTESWDSTGDFFDEAVLLADAESGPNGNLAPLGTSEALATSDFFLV